MLKRIISVALFCGALALTACDSAPPASDHLKSAAVVPVIENSKEATTDSNLETDKAKLFIAAARNGKADEVQALLEEGMALDTSVKWEKTALMEAAWAGQEEMVKMLIEAGAEINRSSATEKGNALYGAAWEGHTAVVKMLVEAGANLNTITQAQNTALWAASFRGHTEIAEILVAAGADVNKKAIHDSPLSAACRSNSIDIVTLLLEHGADPGLRDKYGATPLHYVGELAVAKALLAAGAEVNAPDFNGRTPLANAEQQGAEEVAALLRSAGGSSN